MTEWLDYRLVLLAHSAATAFMVGVIWFVQIVHYPLFESVGHRELGDYSALNQKRTAWVVLPPMLIELGSAPLLLWLAPPGARALVVLVLACLVAIWGSTFFQQVPRHRRLLEGYDAATIRGLVSSNWVRTLLWTIKGLLCFWLLAADS